MVSQCLPIIFLSLFIIGCQPTETKSSTKGKETGYVVNEHDFGDYKKFEQDKSENELKEAKKKKASITKEDSIKTYIKELSHHFHLQEKQKKALEYIYTKYDKKEAQAIQLGDTARLAILTAEKEKSISVVMGENYYAKKGAFDEKYIKKNTKVKPKIPSKKVLKYVSLLTKELKLKQYQIDTIKNVLMRSEDNATKIDSFSLTQLNKKSNLIIEQVLNKSLLSKKEVFDKNYKD